MEYIFFMYFMHSLFSVVIFAGFPKQIQPFDFFIELQGIFERTGPMCIS